VLLIANNLPTEVLVSGNIRNMNKPKRDKKEETTEEAANRIKKQADEQHLLNKSITESSLGWQASSLGL